MHNVEFKAELRDPAVAAAICRDLGAEHHGTLEQTDTYYRVPAGRLKRRECVGAPTEYIFYDRPDRVTPKLSHFTIYTEEEARSRFGTHPMPVHVVVRKRRELYLLGAVRVHLDEVEGLGSFLEFEALVSPQQDVGRCHKRVAELREAFEVVLGESIACGYAEMLARDNDEAD